MKLFLMSVAAILVLANTGKSNNAPLTQQSLASISSDADNDVNGRRPAKIKRISAAKKKKVKVSAAKKKKAKVTDHDVLNHAHTMEHLESS